ncbi:hypothetical protein HYALB_00008546 [Hymenoscyphus albidus]|uniref:MYND-type domain-containing protein n=1 Tax=Hymenoscyphus albidus TaxID=595503 RepID=A0A9N9LPS7_9HELO|nr:hypothetical protein HYALB_00008546 [Hymenoscyphus albidus]
MDPNMDQQMMMDYAMEGYSTKEAFEAFASGEFPEGYRGFGALDGSSRRPRRKPKKRGIPPNKTKAGGANVDEEGWESDDGDDYDSDDDEMEFYPEKDDAAHGKYLNDGLDHDVEEAWRSGALQDMFAQMFGEDMPGKAIDYDSAEYKSKSMSEKAQIGMKAYNEDHSDVMALQALDPSWNRKMHEAIAAGRKTEFLRAENAKAALQITTQRARFRKEFPELARELDKIKAPASVPQTNTDSAVCSLCNTGEDKLTEKLKICSKCKTTRYCSAECQRADWKAHKLTCGKTPA